jgi:hypothetical protein
VCVFSNVEDSATAAEDPCVPTIRSYQFECTSACKDFSTKISYKLIWRNVSDHSAPTVTKNQRPVSKKRNMVKGHMCSDRTPDYDYRCFSDQQGGGDGRETTSVLITTTTSPSTVLQPKRRNRLLHGHRLDAVVAHPQRSARFQLALQSGTLHQELCKATHFGDIDKNRNVLGIQEKVPIWGSSKIDANVQNSGHQPYPLQ